MEYNDCDWDAAEEKRQFGHIDRGSRERAYARLQRDALLLDTMIAEHERHDTSEDRRRAIEGEFRLMLQDFLLEYNSVLSGEDVLTYDPDIFVCMQHAYHSVQNLLIERQISA